MIIPFFHSRCITALAAMVLMTHPLLAEKIFGDFRYTVDESGVTITDFTNSAANNVVIPPLINNRPVVGIGLAAFYNRPRLRNISIPDTVTRIEEDAFFNCISLMDLKLPRDLTRLGQGAFANCESLLEIKLPAGLTALSGGVFQSCRRLRSVSLSPGLTIINQYSFDLCSSLEEITIPDGVTKIGTFAFRGCDKLADVNIPKSVNNIDDYAFYSCDGLTSLRLNEGLQVISFSAFLDCSRLRSVIIPASVKTIGSSAFTGCRSLLSATFLGDAPSVSSSPFYGAAPGFTVYILANSSGFTTPTWQVHPFELTTLAPFIEVRQPTGKPLVSGKAKKSFGTAALESTLRTKSFSIKNIGTAKFSDLKLSVRGKNASDFIIVTQPPESLAINGSTTFKVTFTPTRKGYREALLRIQGKDLVNNHFDIDLSGTGVE